MATTLTRILPIKDTLAATADALTAIEKSSIAIRECIDHSKE